MLHVWQSLLQKSTINESDKCNETREELRLSCTYI